MVRVIFTFSNLALHTASVAVFKTWYWWDIFFFLKPFHDGLTKSLHILMDFIHSTEGVWCHLIQHVQIIWTEPLA